MRAARVAIVVLLLGAAMGGPAAAQNKQFPNVPLFTQDGTPVLFYDDLIKGRVVLINFFFTSCPLICPRTTANLMKVEAALGDRLGRDVRIISISVDPEKDTPRVLSAYSRRYGTKAGWYFVTGKLEDIALLKRHFGVDFYGRNKTDHTGMLVYGNEATQQWAATPSMANPDQIVRSVTRLIRTPVP
jgi:protein SCO1